MPNLSNVIHHWESYFGARTLAEHAHRHPNSMLDRTLPREGIGDAVAFARVSGSCWIADCPSGDGDAEFVNFSEPLFFCCTCRNVGWEHRPLRVKLPTRQQREAVESALLKRPDPRTRNWHPYEGIDNLKVENLTHGIAL